MKNIFLPTFAVLALLLCHAPAQAGLPYPQDPVFNPLDPDETSPMQDMLALAEDNDVRAQYILGDLYSKGKGGLARDDKKAAEWFETAARNGYDEALVRLGALARRQGHLVDALKWYTLAEERLSAGGWRTQARSAREALTKGGKLDKDDFDLARSRVNQWRSESRRARIKPQAQEQETTEKETPRKETQEKETPPAPAKTFKRKEDKRT